MRTKRILFYMVSGVLAAFLNSPAMAQSCVGDCDENGEVALNELIVCVGVVLGSTPLEDCAACDPSGDTAVQVTELIAAVSSSLGSCVSASQTPAVSVTPTPTSTPPSTSFRQCCVPAYYVWNCEDRTVEECATLGGVDKGSGSCSPNPCADLPPSNGHGICCLPNAAGDEIECEDRAAAECVAAGGVVKSGGTVCLPETCADVLPPNPDVRCCLGEDECEDRSASACTAEGGVNMGAGACAPDTCANVSTPDIQCCVPKSDATFECEDRTAEQCANRGGINMGPGDCDPDPCVP